MSATYRLGVDIGGTFTDFVLFDEASSRVETWKSLSTPQDYADGVTTGAQELLRRLGVEPRQIRDFVNGTTLVTNAIIERKGTLTALIATRGFRDVLHIGRELRYDMYDILLDLPRPLIKRRHAYEVDERTLADGEILRALDESAVDDLIQQLRAENIHGAAICFLHSYRNPTNERTLGRLLRAKAPDIAVSLSSEVSPAIREYPRASTTVANAYVQPLVRPYLQRLESRLHAMGCSASLFVMLSNGGVATVENAVRFPVRMIESGPAAGVMAASFYGDVLGLPHLISFDMGGTTAKVTLIRDARPTVTHEFEAARMYRLKKGSGLPISVPAIDMIEIGAGGGSLARVDNLGLIKVGPESAGSTPGPACYALGGEQPTVTDADLVLGYLDADFFLGGRMHLNKAAAQTALQHAVCEPTNLPLPSAAWGVHQIVNEQMASAVRVHAIERGADIRNCALFAFGGAGPVHACQVAEILGLSLVLCPMRASVLSAFGLLSAPAAFDFVRTENRRLDLVDWDHVNAALAEMEDEGRAIIDSAGVPSDAVELRATCDMRYAGQADEISVDLPGVRLGPGSLEGLGDAFASAYQRLYSVKLERLPLEVVNWRLHVSARRAPVSLASIGRSTHPTICKNLRPVYFPDVNGYREVPVYDREEFHAGFLLDGPVLVEEVDTTTVVPPGWRLAVDDYGTLVMRHRQ